MSEIETNAVIESAREEVARLTVERDRWRSRWRSRAIRSIPPELRIGSEADEIAALDILDADAHAALATVRAALAVDPAAEPLTHRERLQALALASELARLVGAEFWPTFSQADDAKRCADWLRAEVAHELEAMADEQA